MRIIRLQIGIWEIYMECVSDFNIFQQLTAVLINNIFQFINILYSIYRILVLKFLYDQLIDKI